MKNIQDGTRPATFGKKNGSPSMPKALGPVQDLERHLPSDWWKTLFNSLYLKTDGDVVENHANTTFDVDMLMEKGGLTPDQAILDVCCGQGRHSLELARRGFTNIQGVDRSRYLIRLARRRSKAEKLNVQFSEGDARRIRVAPNSKDCVIVMGNSFGYFEKEEDDLEILRALQKILKSKGKLILDVVDGGWMKSHFEPRSWEWIDQFHFVNRERSLSSDGKRIITREVITHAERGIIADQFYAERLYLEDELTNLLLEIGFTHVENIEKLSSISSRNQDLGMMANRIILRAQAPEKAEHTIAKTKARRITVITGDPSLPDKVKLEGKFNTEDMATLNRMKAALEENPNYKVEYLDNHARLLNQLMTNPPEFVLNLCDEGYFNNAMKELHVPAILEMLQIPYTGAGPGCLWLCYNKAKVRAIAESLDIPVPLETYFSPDDQAANIPAAFPALLKPACGDSSIGITQKAVVNDAKELVSYLDFLRSELPGTPILVQEYLSGKEYSVGILGNPPNIEVLPILEVDYSGLPKNLPPILSYESKWQPDSPYWTSIRYKEAELDEDTRNKLIVITKQLFEAMECRDYARMDFRCDFEGVPKLLEVNPNPGWCWDGKLNLMAEMGGWSYKDLLTRIVESAWDRTNP